MKILLKIALKIKLADSDDKIEKKPNNNNGRIKK
jgi:hypothetical protein